MKFLPPAQIVFPEFVRLFFPNINVWIKKPRYYLKVSCILIGGQEHFLGTKRLNWEMVYRCFKNTAEACYHKKRFNSAFKYVPPSHGTM